MAISDKKINEIAVHTIEQETKFLTTTGTNTYLVTAENVSDKCKTDIIATYPKINTLGDMDNRITSNTQNITSIQNDIGNDATSGTIKNSLKNAKNDITSLTTRMTAAESSIQGLTAEIPSLTSVQGSINYISGVVDTVSADIVYTQLSVNGLSNIVEELSTKTYVKASANDYGQIKLGYQDDAQNKKYAVSIDQNGRAYVKVPWDAGEDVTDLRNKVDNLTNISTYYMNADGTSKIPDNLTSNINTFNDILINGDTTKYSYTPLTASVPTAMTTLEQLVKRKDTGELTGGVIYTLSNDVEKLKTSKGVEAFPKQSVFCTRDDINPNSILNYGSWSKLGTSDVTNNNTTQTVYFWYRTE